MKHRISALFLSSVLVFSACSQASDSAAPAQESIRIGVSFPTTDLAYRQKMLKLLTEYDQQHPDVELMIRDGENSQEKQNRDVLEMIEESVQGIILIPYTMEGPIPVIHYANEKNIPVLTLDNDVLHLASARTVGYVGSDHQEMGRLAAGLLLQALQTKFPNAECWNVLYLTGVAESSGAVERDLGIRSVLGSAADVQLIGTYNGQFTSENAQSILEDCLLVYPGIHGVVCQNDLMAEGCLTALQKAGLSGSIVVVGVDGQRSAVQAIANGTMNGTVWQDPSMAVIAADSLLDYLDSRTPVGTVYTDIEALNEQNAQEYLRDGLSW